MQILPVIAVLIATLAGAVEVQPPATYPPSEQDAVALYQFALRQIPTEPLSPDVTSIGPSDYIGRAVELYATLAGRIAVNADSPEKRSILFRLQLPSGVSVCATSTGELKGLEDGDSVRAILDVPEGDPHEARFRLRAIMHASAPPKPAPPPQNAPGAAPLSFSSAVPTQPGAPAPATSGPAPGANLALPPEYREQGPSRLSLAPFAIGVNGEPRQGKQGAWDPVGNTGYPVLEQSKLDTWKRWVLERNDELEPWQADWIVRWVIYYSALNGVDHRLMFAMIKCESDFKPFCVSRAGAVGLTQLMPCNIQDYKVVNQWNVQEQLRAGIKHFKEMLDMWEGRSNYEQFALGAASYNAGPNRVKRSGGVPNIKETRGYVKKLGDLFYKLVKEGYP